MACTKGIKGSQLRDRTRLWFSTSASFSCSAGADVCSAVRAKLKTARARQSKPKSRVGVLAILRCQHVLSLVQGSEPQVGLKTRHPLLPSLSIRTGYSITACVRPVRSIINLVSFCLHFILGCRTDVLLWRTRKHLRRLSAEVVHAAATEKQIA